MTQWLLTERKARYERTSIGNTLLIIAAKENYVALAQWLFKEGFAKLEEQNNDGDTALMWAAYKNHLDMVKWLLSEGACINTCNRYNRNALEEALLTKKADNKTQCYLYHYYLNKGVKLPDSISSSTIDQLEGIKKTEIIHFQTLCENDYGAQLPLVLIVLIYTFETENECLNLCRTKAHL